MQKSQIFCQVQLSGFLAERTTTGGAFLIPFTSRAGGQLSPDGKLVTVTWHGRQIHLPSDYLGHYAVHGSSTP
jgi:hypothetical protein